MKCICAARFSSLPIRHSPSARARTHTHTHTHTCSHARAHTHIYTNPPAHAPSHTHTHDLKDEENFLSISPEGVDFSSITLRHPHKRLRAYVSIRQHTSAYRSIRPERVDFSSITHRHPGLCELMRIRQHTSAYVNSAYVSIRQHTSNRKCELMRAQTHVDVC